MIKISVNQFNIKLGEAKSYNNCPVARALKTTFKLSDDDDLGVYYDEIIVKGKIYKTPAIVRVFIQEFDDELPVQPFSFELS